MVRYDAMRCNMMRTMMCLFVQRAILDIVLLCGKHPMGDFDRAYRALWVLLAVPGCRRVVDALGF